MEPTDIINITLGILTSIGGGAALVVGLSKYFGDIWAKRYLENHKNELREQFEQEKRNIELEFEKSKTKYLRYSNRQFELYQTLWEQLVDLKDKADELWEVADDKNLKNFASTLRKTKTAVNKSKLFLENEHYDNLSSLLKEFADFQIDKKKLINLRLKKDTDNNFKRNLAERFIVRQNEQRMEQYNVIITDIAQSFKDQIKQAPAT